MKIYKGADCILPCCFDMKVQFQKDYDGFDPKKIEEKDILSCFFYDSITNDVNLRLLEQGIDGETKEPFLHFAWYIIHYCPFCGAKIEVLD